MPDKQVVIVNRLSQKLSVTVNSGTGNREIDLPPRGRSVPVDESSVTEYTHSLATQGHIKLSSVR